MRAALDDSGQFVLHLDPPELAILAGVLLESLGGAEAFEDETWDRLDDPDQSLAAALLDQMLAAAEDLAEDGI